jgi:hypothetical protein
VVVAFHRHSVDFTCRGRFSKVGSGSNTLLHTESGMLPAAVIQQLQHSCETADPAVMTAQAVEHRSRCCCSQLSATFGIASHLSQSCQPRCDKR